MCATYDHANANAAADTHTDSVADTNAHTVADTNTNSHANAGAMPVPTHKTDAATTGHDGDHGDGDTVEYRASWLCWPGNVSHR